MRPVSKLKPKDTIIIDGKSETIQQTYKPYQNAKSILASRPAFSYPPPPFHCPLPLGPLPPPYTGPPLQSRRGTPNHPGLAPNCTMKASARDVGTPPPNPLPSPPSTFTHHHPTEPQVSQTTHPRHPRATSP